MLWIMTSLLLSGLVTTTQGFVVLRSPTRHYYSSSYQSNTLFFFRRPMRTVNHSLISLESTRTTTTTTSTSTATSSSLLSTTTATTKRLKSKSKRKKVNHMSTTTTNNHRKGEKGHAISEQELIDHVSSLYMQQDPDECNDHEEQDITTDRFKKYPALVLNADYLPMSYLPLSMWNWQDAIKAVFAGKVTVVDVYPDTVVRAARLEIPLPSVIALNEYVPHYSEHATPAFTRRNVFLRDEYRCQYCRQAFHTRDLSLDHVVPRSMGGNLNWNNAVTCCRQCNGRKGNLLPSQLRQVGMKLHREPRPPSQFQLAQLAGRMLPRKVHSTWKPYLVAVAGDTTNTVH